MSARVSASPTCSRRSISTSSATIRRISAGPDRDRFLLSTGHYSIALWAALAECGILPMDELTTYGADDSRLEMSTLDTTPGVEMIGGSLGHGLGQGVGMALGLRHRQVAGAGLRRALRRRDAGGLDLGGGDGGREFPARQSRRADRLQRHPGRRQDGARHGAGRRQVARVRLGDAGNRRQRHERDRRRLARARAAATAGRRRSCCAPCRAKACRRWRSARRRTSSGSTPASGTTSARNSSAKRS